MRMTMWGSVDPVISPTLSTSPVINDPHTGIYWNPVVCTSISMFWFANFASNSSTSFFVSANCRSSIAAPLKKKLALVTLNTPNSLLLLYRYSIERLQRQSSNIFIELSRRFSSVSDLARVGSFAVTCRGVLNPSTQLCDTPCKPHTHVQHTQPYTCAVRHHVRCVGFDSALILSELLAAFKSSNSWPR